MGTKPQFYHGGQNRLKGGKGRGGGRGEEGRYIWGQGKFFDGCIGAEGWDVKGAAGRLGVVRGDRV